VGAYDTERVGEVAVLLYQTRDTVPNWVQFQCDYPVEFKRIVHWLLTNSSSPMDWQRDGKPIHKAVIQWATGDGQWTANVKAPPVLGKDGRRGRIRIRKPRDTPNS
jgi:hypothetical protein